MFRLCANWTLEVYGFGEKLSDHITEFFKIYAEQMWDESTMFKHRIQIRGNQHLNKLLHDNSSGIRSVYERYK